MVLVSRRVLGMAHPIGRTRRRSRKTPPTTRWDERMDECGLALDAVERGLRSGPSGPEFERALQVTRRDVRGAGTQREDSDLIATVRALPFRRRVGPQQRDRSITIAACERRAGQRVA